VENNKKIELLFFCYLFTVIYEDFPFVPCCALNTRTTNFCSSIKKARTILGKEQYSNYMITSRTLILVYKIILFSTDQDKFE